VAYRTALGLTHARLWVRIFLSLHEKNNEEIAKSPEKYLRRNDSRKMVFYSKEKSRMR